MSKYLKDLKVTDVSLLEIMGHTFLFSNVLAGPNHHFSDYRDFINGGNYCATVCESGLHNFCAIIRITLY